MKKCDRHVGLRQVAAFLADSRKRAGAKLFRAKARKEAGMATAFWAGLGGGEAKCEGLRFGDSF